MCVQFRVLLFIILFIGILPGNAKAEENGSEDGDNASSPRAELERESPPSLLQTEIGDSAVDLFILGSWQTRLGFDVGLARPRAGADIPGLPSETFTSRGFPGFETPAYQNIVDLTLSLRLDDRYFFEASFIDDIDQDFEVDSLLFGYDGRPDEVLQSLRFGLGPLSMPSYPYMPAGEAAGNTFGASATLASASSRHDLLARFEPTASETVRYLGRRSLSETRIDPTRFIRNRRFVLPDAGIENLRVFREVSTANGGNAVSGGDGRGYEEIDLNREASFSLAQGTLTLDEPADGRLVATYTVNGQRVGGEGLGEDFLLEVNPDGTLDPERRLDANVSKNGGLGSKDGAAYLEAIGRPPESTNNGEVDEEQIELFFDVDGVRGVLLYEPGYFSPFTRADAYAVDGLDPEDEAVTVEYLRSGRRVSADIPVRPVARSSDDGRALMLGDRGPRSARGRYPFGPESQLYGPGAPRRGEEASFDIVIEQTDAPGAISVSSNVIPGTVSLLRNGIPETRFEVDSGGNVELGFQPGDRDTLEFRYRTYDRGADAGELVFASGNRFDVFDSDSVTLSVGGRWDISEMDFTTEAGERDGNITLSSSYEHEGEFLDAFVRGAGSLEVADTTGARRLFGMQEQGIPVGQPSYRLLPGAPPEDFDWRSVSGADSRSFSISDDGADDYAPGGRGKLLYRDYRVDGQLQPFDTELDASHIYAYEPGSLIGPYATRGPDGERLTAFEYELESDQWVSGQIQLPPDGDTMQAEGIRFHWRAVDAVEEALDGTVDIYVQFGATGEDLDGDGTLDEGISATRPTFDFFDDSDDAGFSLRAGGVAKSGGSRATEDGTGTGFLAAEDSRRIVSRKIASGLDATESKRHVTISFTERERRLVSEGRAVRLVIAESGNSNGGQSAAGRVLVGGVEVVGTPLLARAVERRNGEFVRAPADDDPANNAGTPSVTAAEVSEKNDLLENEVVPLDEPLGSRFPDTLRFGTDRDDQKVLKLSYLDLDDSITDGDPERRVELRGITAPALLREYQELVFYVYTASAGELITDIYYGDGEEAGVSAEDIVIPEDETSWQEVRIGLSSGEISINGERTGGQAQVDASVEANRLILRTRPGETSDTEARHFYLDEIHLSGSRPGVTARFEAGLRYTRDGELFRITDSIPVGDLELGMRSSVEADISESTISSVTGDADLAVNVSLVRLSGTVGAAYSPAFDDLTLRAGHGVRFPVTESVLDVEDRYSRDFTGEREADRESRLTSLSLSFEQVETESLARAAFSGGRLNQSWQSDISWRPPRLSLSAGVSQTSRQYTPPHAGYGESWIRSYALLAGYEPEKAAERSARASLSRSPSEAVLSPTGRFDARYRTVAEADEQRSESTAEIGVRWSLGANGGDDPIGNGEPQEAWDEGEPELPDGETGEPAPETQAEDPAASPFSASFRNLSIEPFYRRQLNVREPADTGAYAEDLRRYGNVLAEEQYLYTSPPFVELFQPVGDSVFGEIDSGRERVFYRPSTGLRARRSFGSRIGDLIVPYRLEADLGRSYERREDALRADSDARFSVSTFAVNLFGRLGAYSLADFYSSDEFFGTLSGQFSFAPGRDYRLTWETGARFFGHEEAQLEVQNEYSIRRSEATDQDNESTVAYTWHTPATFAETVPWPVEYEQARFVHREEVKLGISRSTRERATEYVRLELGHSSTLELDNTASIAARMRAGWEQEQSGDEPAVDFFGLKGELEATFRF